MTVEVFCNRADRLEQCVACPILYGDVASIMALNVLMRSADPNQIKSRDLRVWAEQASANFLGADPLVVEQAAREHAAGNCTSDYLEI